MKKQPATKTSSKAIVPKKAQPLSTNVSDLAMEDAGAGQENMTRGDFAIPRLTLLQSLSPQIKKTDALYIKGAEEGQILDALNTKVFSGEKGIVVIPVSYRRAYIEWTPRQKGGGFVKDWGSDEAVLSQVSRSDSGLTFKNGNTLQTQGEYFVLLINEDGTGTPYVLSMASSQLKKSRRWNTIMNQLQVAKPNGQPGTFNPAMFYRSYKLTTVPEQNQKGSFFGWKIEPGEFTLKLDNGEELYMAARNLRASISAGTVQAAAPTAPHSEAESENTPM